MSYFSQEPASSEYLPHPPLLLGSAPVDGVPVLTRCDRHVADRKYLFNSSKVAEHPPRLAQTTLAPDFHCLIKGCTIKQPVQNRDQGRICGRIINRACDHQSISLRKLHRQLIHHIVEHTLPKLRASITGNTSSYRLTADLHDLRVDSSFSNTVFISFNAIDVFPFARGLPLIINTFIIYPPHSNFNTSGLA